MRFPIARSKPSERLLRPPSPRSLFPLLITPGGPHDGPLQRPRHAVLPPRRIHHHHGKGTACTYPSAATTAPRTHLTRHGHRHGMLHPTLRRAGQCSVPKRVRSLHAHSCCPASVCPPPPLPVSSPPQLTAVDVAGTNAVEGVRQAFWASSALALACAMHCIINSTFAAVWGPGLSLRGPEGSVSKAYWGMTRERKHIMVSYVGALFFFVLQSIFAFHILDGITGASPSSIIATVVRTGYV